MSRLPLVACSLVLSLATTAPAVAAPEKKPKPLCYLVVDDKGGGVSPAMDVHSADVATGHQTLVAAIRLATTESDGDPVAALGLRWAFSFTIRGQKYTFERRRSVGLTPTYAYTMSPNPTNAQVAYAVDATTVKFIVPRSAVPELMQSGKKVLGSLAVNGTWLNTTADTASSRKTYPDKHPHCLEPR